MSKKRVQIFVEGIADKKFLEDYLSHIKDELIIDIKEVTDIGGKDKLSLKKPIFELNYPDVKNIIIFDADVISKTREDFAKYDFIKSYEIDVFLFPNNKIDGDLETILENIINKENSDIFDCWNSYETCLNTKEKKYTTPARKTKIYAYLEALLGETNKEKDQIKEKERDYTNTNHWDLDSNYLEPLKTFLTNLK